MYGTQWFSESIAGREYCGAELAFQLDSPDVAKWCKIAMFNAHVIHMIEEGAFWIPTPMNQPFSFCLI